MLRPGRFIPSFIISALLLFLVACGGQTSTQQDQGQQDQGGKVKEGDTVTVNYRGTLDSGHEFDSSYGGEPLTFVVGSGQLIKGFDTAVRGLAVGEKKKFRLEPDDAYGQREEQLIFEVPLAQAPEGIKAGDQVQLSNGAPATIAEVNGETVKVDANHPLAGQALTFEIEVVGVK